MIMKKNTITLVVLIAFAIACKKDSNKQKCYWSANSGSRVVNAWHNKPSSDQVKKAQDSCSCQITVEEHCFPCNMTVTDPGGTDVECR
jgi:hypothetical protein